MKKPKKKHLDKFREVFDYYVRLGDDPKPAHFSVLKNEGIEIVLDKEGASSIEASWVFETYGKKDIRTTEPNLVAKFLDGKKWHGVNVENWSESIIEGTLSLSEFRTYGVPSRFFNEVLGRVAKRS